MNPRDPQGPMPASMSLPRPPSHTRLRLLLAGALVLALSACATMPLSLPGGTTPQATADSAQAEQWFRDGDFERAADEFGRLADARRGEEAAHYRLRAAESLREAGKLDAAARVLGDLSRRRLRGDEPARLDLLDAEIALKHGDAAQALSLLAYADDMPPALRPRALELRARGELAGGDAFASARTRARLDRDLAGPDRQQNGKQILDALAPLDAQTLRDRAAALAPGDPLRPWIEQAMRGRGEALARNLAQPSLPVGTLRPGGNDGALEPEGYQALRQVALLLPLGAQLASVSQSIRDGFLTAWFADDPGRRPTLRIYDSGKTPADAVAAYEQAVADGADHVVGPLQRESVGELFHQPLTAHVLALNHPDTGEVPPAGSAEFGLLPDAEGARVAEHMLARGLHRAAVIVADADWAERAARAFRAQFEAGGGAIAGETRLRDKDVNFATAITQATAALGAGSDTGVFISMRPQQARLLLPQLKVAGVGAPVFATSHVYAGDANAALDRDLDGVEFCDAPWLLGTVVGRPDRNRIASQLASANGVGARLFAFGMDAYALLPYLDWLLAHPDAYVDGATGQLAADSYGRIHRVVGWARFANGIAQPVDGALSTAPVP